jgi:hypothetical protein
MLSNISDKNAILGPNIKLCAADQVTSSGSNPQRCFTNCLRVSEAVTEKLKSDIEELRDDFAIY